MIKLVKCYLENFGKFSRFSFDFDQGLNIINQANGWGKSTLATFIKAMFYGLASNRSKDLAKNEREKYLPWQGGNFGGNLEFIINGKHYRIERFFGKTSSEDTFKLSNVLTGKISDDYGENIGEALFGLDAEGFQRTLFIPQRVLDTNINQSISKRLIDLIQGTTEDFDYQAAQKILDEERRLLSNRNGTGQIEKIKDAIQDKTNAINELNNLAAALPERQAQVDAAELAIQKLSDAQSAVKQQIKDCVQRNIPGTNQGGHNKYLWLLAAVWVILGVVCLTLNKVGLWIMFGVCGVALLVAVLVAYCRRQNKSSAPVSDINALQTRETDLQNQIDQQRESKAAYLVQIKQIQNDLTTLNNLENEQQSLKEQLATLNEKFAAVQNAAKFLAAANDSLSTQFLQPMKNGLRKYLGLLTGQDFANLQLDTEFNLTFDELGRSRNVEYYSKGYQNTFELCLRLALLEAIWGQDKPFVILDDPFVNLDEAKIANAKKFLQQLSTECQIIYFTCHPARC